MTTEHTLPDAKGMRKALTLLREEIDMALGAVEDNSPWLETLKLRNCTFDSGTGEFRFTLSGQFKGGKSKEESIYPDFAAALAIQSGQPGDPWYKPGLKLPPLNTLIMLPRGEQIQVIGARPRASKFNVLVEYTMGPRKGKKMLYRAADIAAFWSRQSREGAPT